MTDFDSGTLDRGMVRRLDDITVIIPTVGRPILEKCIRSIINGTALPAEIIVVDQGSNPEVAAWLRAAAVHGLQTLHLPSAERSPGSARNCGLEQVKTRFVAALDDDCLASPDWLESLSTILHENPEAIVTGRLEASGDGTPPTVITSTAPYTHTRPSIRIHSPLGTANVGFALTTARRIGPFDGTVSAAEDNDWAYRALRGGIPIMYSPRLLVYHVHWRNADQLTEAYRSYAWSQGAFYGKHLRKGDWSMALRAALSLYRGCRELAFGMATSDPSRRSKGVARITCLIPGVVAGIRGSATPS